MSPPKHVSLRSAGARGVKKIEGDQSGGFRRGQETGGGQ